MTTFIGALALGTNGNDNNASQTGPVNDTDLSHTIYGFGGYDVIFADGGNDTAYGGDDGDAIFGGNGNDVLLGEAGDDFLNGDAGDNTLYGGSGNDTVVVMEGISKAYGGTGYDTIDYSYWDGPVRIELGGVGPTGHVLSGFEAAIGTIESDVLVGTSGANRLEALNGNDNVFGGDGKDDIYGGLGDDYLVGGNGADSLEGSAGNDTASYIASGEGVSVYLDTGLGYSGTAAGDRLGSIENLFGSDHDDYLLGSLFGNTIAGRDGNDWIKGGAGQDSLDGGTGKDIVSYSYSAAAVTVDLGAGTASGGDAQGDHIARFESVTGSDHDDQLKGSGGANQLNGGAGDDSIAGRGGSDVIVGGSGADVMDGGDGADSFVFYFTVESEPGQAHRDTIKGFVHGTDEIDLSFIDARLHTSGAQAFTFIGNDGFTKEGQVRVYQDGADTVIEVNNDGAGGADLELLLLGHKTITAGDFVL
ncbi:MAG: calcium-binding protein [Geminicoccaceae bacterium]